jgi:hypothetical protein
MYWSRNGFIRLPLRRKVSELSRGGDTHVRQVDEPHSEDGGERQPRIRRPLVVHPEGK